MDLEAQKYPHQGEINPTATVLKIYLSCVNLPHATRECVLCQTSNIPNL